MTVKGNDDGDRDSVTGAGRLLRGREVCETPPAPRHCSERPRLRPLRRRADLPCNG
jgi:hypothetical protein